MEDTATSDTIRDGKKTAAKYWITIRKIETAEKIISQAEKINV